MPIIYGFLAHDHTYLDTLDNVGESGDRGGRGLDFSLHIYHGTALANLARCCKAPDMIVSITREDLFHQQQAFDTVTYTVI